MAILQNQSKLPNKQGGFTLVELMITIAIIGIIAALAAPSMINIIRKNQLDSDVREAFNALQEARSEAILSKQDKTVIIEAKEKTTMTTKTINYDFMGRASDTSCFEITHKQDPTLKAGIQMRRTATPEIKPSCS